ncbi:hypothetical protein Rsub_01261 [Raphidocelis subcapitata]|uniref:Endonuclease/exonuclease/phosphatase domain-containing protein n=1 Tax=Raphidocelis subcapitata TaxID=307507 RepID=A0A2V0NM53_9CHLO|nr:hypothetical protein Rsub_01261 [Raphidocelis subcapitata]|eukprot:GBF88546.1 hypothetical protein Rsub_01261 [Raphidocelis subcapitata]
MAEPIDLTLSSDEDDPMPRAPAGGAAVDEEEQRRRIMSFAAGVRGRAAKRARQDSDSDSDGSPPPAQQVQPQQRAAAADGGSGGGGPSSAGGSGNSLLAQLHAERLARARQQGGAEGGLPAGGSGTAGGSGGGDAPPPKAARASPPGRTPRSASPPPSGAAAARPRERVRGGGEGQQQQARKVSLLQYNVWFNEEAALEVRMAEIGRIVEDCGYPTFVTLQEVTPTILALLCRARWWGRYVPSDPPEGSGYFTLLLARRDAVPGAVVPRSFRRSRYPNSVMGRCLLTLTASVAGVRLAVATSHLESPCPPGGMYVKARRQQMQTALEVLEDAPAPNVLFAGDMNWSDERDGAPPLKAGWCDAWASACPGQPGFTYDTRSNAMLTGNWPGARLDRVLCKLQDLRITGMRLVGTEPIPGATYRKAFRNGSARTLPVLPSDHYGLLLEMEVIR